MFRTLAAAAALTLTAAVAAAQTNGPTLLGVNGRPTPATAAAGPKSNGFLEAAKADQAHAAGFVVTGSSGLDAAGFAQSVNFRSARLYGDYARQGARHQKGVEYGAEGTVTDPGAIRRAYDESVRRAAHHEFMLKTSETTMQLIHLAHQRETDPTRRDGWAAQYRAEAARVSDFAKARAAETAFQRELRPGR